MKNQAQAQAGFSAVRWIMVLALVGTALFFVSARAIGATAEFNSTGGTSATNGLRFYLEDTTKLQVRRLNNSGQVYSPSALPGINSQSLDNGIFIRANGRVYGPSDSVSGYSPNGGMYNTYSITPEFPSNPSSSGVQQIANAAFGINSGPQVSILWKYTTPLGFITADVTLTIPPAYAVSAANPVRYNHVVDTYLGGSDQGCGVKYTTSDGKLVVGTYPPPSGTSCPSNSSLPSGVTIIESFRERIGAFSSYCATNWSTLFSQAGDNCSVSQAAAMSKTIAANYQDTGIGIQYAFTASGTYTFSYDFVIGSPVVPPYDHIEIQHDGSGSLCSENVTVLACTVSAVPCPEANRVSTGTLTGTLTTTPANPAVTKFPLSFSIGSDGATAAVSLLASAAGTYTLGTSGLSAVPLNGTKCWNTATGSQDCNLTFADVPCCVTDTFATGTLDTTLWNVAGVGYTPQVVTSPTVTSNRLRLTDNSGGRATFAQLKKWFPGANNKVVVEFDFFAWGSNSGADGVSMVLSDASVAPTPGGYGGSLGYANRSGGDGFGGGWLGIGLDEFGNFPGTGEGRRDYPAGYAAPAGATVAAGFAKNSISVRGSGSGQSAGYALLANTGTLTTAVQTGTNTTDSTTKHRYRVTMDHSNSVNAFVSVERDTTGTGSSYTTVIPAFDIKAAAAGQAPVPENMLLSFTGSTGGSTNNHEIANVRVCASTINPVGGNASAVNFECMDAFLSESAYVNRQTNPSGRNPTFTKLARTPFKLRLVPLANNGSVKTDYVTAGGSSRNVTVEIFDDNTAPAPVCSAYSATNLVATQGVTLSSGVAFLTGDLTVNKAYTKLRCRVTDNAVAGSPVYGCGSDQFAVRPGAVTLSTSATAAAPSASAGPTIKAGANFNLRATTSTNSTDQYAGTLTQNTSALTAQDTSQDTSQVNGGVVGTLAPASLVGNAPAANATYTEAGYLYLAAGAYLDTTYTVVDQVGDCVANSTSVTLSSGKYGCVIGNTAAVSLGRFIPDRFAITPGAVVPSCRLHPVASPGYTPTDFTYFSQPEGFTTPFTLRALNVSGNPTQNYAGAFARISSWNSATTTSSWTWTGTSSATGLRFGTASALPIGSSLAAATVSGVPVTPIGNWASGVTALSMVQHQVSRPTALTGETSVTITALPIDPDGVTLSGAVAVSSSDTPLRWGRVRMQNAYGSERLSLAVPVQAQFYDAGTATFKANPDDSCTPLTVPIARTLSGSAVPDGVPNQYFYPVTGKNQLLASDTTASLKTVTGGSTTGLIGGAAVLSFTAPSIARPTANTSGWLDLILGVPTYLTANWNNCMGQTGGGLHDDLPCARVTFGVYKSPLIYRRENY